MVWSLRVGTERQTDVQTDRWTDRQTHGRTDGQTDRHMHGQTDVYGKTLVYSRSNEDISILIRHW